MNQELSSPLKNGPLTALSPLDGRYMAKVEVLRLYFSEFALMRYRVRVEVEWLIALSDADLAGFDPLSEAARRMLRLLVHLFSEDDAAEIKQLERATNHDVKAVEYWLKSKLAGDPEFKQAGQFVHFACTSEDINCTSYALMLADARGEVLLPTIGRLITVLHEMAVNWADVPMLARTHGQAASPTTVGKEIANVVARLEIAYACIEGIPLRAKMNGAVGNYNAHLAAYPDFDWEKFSCRFIEKGLALSWNGYTTQIEPHDCLAELFDAIVRCNTICIDWCRDVWGYVSLGYFKQQLKAGEVGSSTMPHKVNPIDFENAEGNYGLANALFTHMSQKLPISRFQRDLTDSTVLRNMGVALGYALLAHTSLRAGLGKLSLDEARVAADLEPAWEVLTEAIQTVMRAHGLEGGYEQLKELTRGQRVTRETLQSFIDGLTDLPLDVRNRLKAMTPASYTGLAPQLADPS